MLETVRALHDYTANESSCISFKKDDIIIVHEKDTSGWWDGTLDGSRGWFPSNFVVAEQISDDVPVQHHDEILEHELPDNWVRKQMQSGQGYYVNVNTNEKTYDLDAVMASSGLQGRSNESRNGEHVITNAGKAISENINVHYTQLSNNRASKSLLDNVSTSELTWELLINNILKTISDLNYSAKNDIKARYVQESNSIVNSIRDLLGCSKMTSDGCQLLKKYPVLLPHHTNIMNSLSKMSLAARVAGGLWPSADAVHKMRYQAGQVLLSVRHFVAAAQELSITLSPMSESDIDFFDAKEFELVDWEILSRLETVSDSIMNGIADLVTVITRERRMSVQLIELIRKCVIEIGQMLSFLEDLQVLETPASRKLFHEFLLKKSQLYTASNDLVTASNAGDDFGPSNTLGVILECTTSVLEAVDETVLSTRQLFGVKGIIVHDDFQNYQEENTPLEDLYRRISSLHFSEADSNSAQNSSRRGSSSRAGPDSDGALYNNRSSRGRAEKRNPLVVDPKLTHRTSSLVVTDVENGGSSPGSLRSPEEFGSANKLAKFFGEDTNSAAGPKSADLMKPWFLKREMTNELSYNMEGAINGGTFPALVERLTAHEHQVNPVFATSFLMTFHLFGTSTQLLDELIGRFMLSSPDNLSQDEHYLWVTKKLSLIQIRVCNAFKAWLEHYWREEHDDVCLDRIYSFASGPMMQSQPALAARLQDLVSKRINSDVYGRGMIKPKNKPIIRQEDFPLPFTPKNLLKFNFFDLEATEIARQLTLIESAIFAKITPMELMNQEWSKKENTRAVHVRAMTSLSTKITVWAMSKILSETDVRRRAVCLKFFIKIADRCLDLNNFNTLMAFQSAFNSSTIARLKKTWDLLSSRTKATVKNLKSATDHNRNYADYRANLKKAQLPVLPFLGLFLTDLTFTDDGNQDIRSGGKLINFDKFAKTAKIIQDVIRYQAPYPLAEVPEIQTHLLLSIDERGTKDSQSLYEISLRLEPREGQESARQSATVTPEEMHRELEAKIEMLERAGML